jgi:hypothetical protein
MSMTVGRVRTPEFRVNLNRWYGIEIEVERKIPFYTLNCLLGTHMGRASTNIGDCPDRPSVVKATWSLVSGGRVVASGSSDDYRAGGWGNGTISRELGHFQAQSGRRYVLFVNVLRDGTALAPGDPRLVVEVVSSFYEDAIAGDAIAFLCAGLLVVAGLPLLSISFFRRRRGQKDPVVATNSHKSAGIR